MSGVDRKELLDPEVGTGENKADAGDEGVGVRSKEEEG